MNIRTVLSLGGPELMYKRYKKEVNEVLSVLIGKVLVSGFVYGIASFLQFVTFALIFFLASVYINNYDLDINGPL